VAEHRAAAYIVHRGFLDRLATSALIAGRRLRERAGIISLDEMINFQIPCFSVENASLE
jgi:hypothetical protein